jgi:hypothetical protein
MHINTKELYIGAHSMKKNVDLLQRDVFTWVTDSQTVKYAIDSNVDHPIELSPVIKNIRLTMSTFDFECKHVNGVKIPLVDGLNRIGEDGVVQELRNKLHRDKLFRKLNYRKNNKDYYGVSMKTFLNCIHLLTDNEIRNSEIEMKWGFKCNDDYYNYRKAKFAFYEIRCGNISILDDGISFEESIDNNILKNNLRLNPNTNIKDYIVIKQIVKNDLIGEEKLLDINDEMDIKMIQSICKAPVLKYLDNNRSIIGVIEEFNKELIENSIYYRLQRLHNSDIELLKEKSLLNILENKNINEKRINNIINSNIIENNYELTGLFKLEKEEKRKFLLNKHKEQLQQSPFNINTNNTIIKPILKKQLMIRYPNKPIYVSDRELDLNLQLAKINRNNNQSQSLVKISTTAALSKKFIKSNNNNSDNNSDSKSNDNTHSVNVLRRSARLASKPKISYKEDDFEKLPEKQYSGGIDGYESGLVQSQILQDNDDLKLFCQLKNKGLSNKEKEEIFKLDDIRVCQALDTKCKKAIEYLNGNPEAIKYYRPRRDSVWINGLRKGYFKIEFGILFYNDNTKHNLLHKNGRMVTPNKHKIPLVKFHHFCSQNCHSGAEITLDLIEQRYWWQDMKEDVELIVKSCRVCNLAKGNTGTMALNSWTTTQCGELVFYDFGGPYFKSFYIFVIIDNHSGKVMLVLVLSADAITVCDVLLRRWIPDQGFPIQLGSDIGSSNLNDLMDIFFEITGVQSFFASGRRHESIGKVENVIKLVNKHMRSLNIELDGQLTDKFDRETAIHRVQMYLPGIEFHLNARKQQRSGLSANLLDKGRQLRGIGDTQLALEKLKKMRRNGSSKADQIQYLQDLQMQLLLYQNIKNEKDRMYLWRNMNRHNNNNNRDYNYKSGEYVGYYIGDRSSTHINKWNALYEQCIFIKMNNSGEAVIKTMKDNRELYISKRVLKPFHSNDQLWKPDSEFNLLESEKEKLKQKSSKINFSPSVSVILSDTTVYNEKLREERI